MFHEGTEADPGATVSEFPGLDDRQRRQVHRLLEEGPSKAGDLLLHRVALSAQHMHAGLRQAMRAQAKLRHMLDEITSPPWETATLLATTEVDGVRAATVLHRGVRQVVRVRHNGGTPLLVGTEVLLSRQGNVVLGPWPSPGREAGELMDFDRQLPDGRLVTRSRDEEVIVVPAASLDLATLRTGAALRVDRACGLAFEAVPRNQTKWFLESTPAVTFADIGGLDAQIAELKRTVDLRFHHHALRDRYQLPAQRSIFMVGPPGTGKTLLAKALANYLASRLPSGRAQFMNIRPGELHSVWYSQSEANYREAFRLAREASSEAVPVVMFFDEVDAIAAPRGRSLHQVDDRVLTAFMTELNGLDSGGNILVVAATNRLDGLDPALLRGERLKDALVRVPRPDRQAARHILERHLPREIPYAPGNGSGDARDAIIEMALARIFAPNTELVLATVVLRNGQRRIVRPAEVVSGAALANVARIAITSALNRHLETQVEGVRAEDLLEAVDREFLDTALALSPQSCPLYLEGLTGGDVASVEPIAAGAAQSYRFLHDD